MQQSPSSEANQEILRILRNPKVHYRIHKCPPPVPILSQLDPVHTPTSHFLKIHLNIVLPSTSGSPKLSLSLRFPHQIPVYASPLLSSPLPRTHYMLLFQYGVHISVCQVSLNLSHVLPLSLDFKFVKTSRKILKMRRCFEVPFHGLHKPHINQFHILLPNFMLC